jgi:hypothetical protein
MAKKREQIDQKQKQKLDRTKGSNEYSSQNIRLKLSGLFEKNRINIRSAMSLTKTYPNFKKKN